MSRTLGVARSVAAAGALVLLAGGADARSQRVRVHEVPRWVREAADQVVHDASEDLVWLHRETRVQPLATGGVRETRRAVARVLTPDGLPVATTLSVTYRATADEVVRVSGWARQPEGGWRAPRGSSAERDEPHWGTTNVHDDVRARVLEVPGARVGEVVAVESVVLRGLDLGAADRLFGSPTRSSLRERLVVDVPDGWQRAVVLERGESLSVTETARRIVVEGGPFEPLSDARLRPPPGELLPRAWVSWAGPDGRRGFSDWPDVGTWFRELSDDVLRDPKCVAPVADRLAPAEGADAEALLAALEAAFDHAAREVRYVSIQVGIGGFRPAPPARTCARGHGDCKAKSFLLRALVEPWGLRAWPVLVRTRDGGELLEAVPTPAQFDHCIVAIELPDGVAPSAWNVVEAPEPVGRVLVVDPTDRTGTVLELPPMDQDTTALLVHGAGAELVRLPEQPPRADRASRRLIGRLEPDGDLAAGRLDSEWTGARAGTWRRWIASSTREAWSEALGRIVASALPGARIESDVVEGLERVGGELSWSAEVEGGSLGRRAADLLILEPGRVVPSLLDTELPPPPREWDLVLGAPSEDETVVELALPPGWRVEDLPGPEAIEGAGLRALTAWEGGTTHLRFTVRSSLTSSTVTAEDYASFRDAALALERATRQPVVLVPAPAVAPGGGG